MNDGATYVIELTPPGKAAVAVLLVDGPLASDAVANCVTKKSRHALKEWPFNRIALALWGKPIGEEVIVCRRAVDQIEIHCHGGAATIKRVADRLIEQGCQPMSWRAWVRRHECDPLRAVARIALADAPTERTAAILLDQFHGALSAAIRQVIDAIRALDNSTAWERLNELIGRGPVGLHLTSPWQVVLAGPPNVGKSSLLNALAGFKRAIVSPLPGTTRDVVRLATAIDGWPVTLSDTAGLRLPGDELEAEGVQRTQAAMSRADLILAVEDATDVITNNSDSSSSVIHSNRESSATIRVINKTDLLHARSGEWASRLADPCRGLTVLTSAVTGAGIARLIQVIGQRLVPHPPPPGAAVPFSRDQVAALMAARDDVQHGDTGAALSHLQQLLAPNASTS